MKKSSRTDADGITFLVLADSRYSVSYDRLLEGIRVAGELLTAQEPGYGSETIVVYDGPSAEYPEERQTSSDGSGPTFLNPDVEGHGLDFGVRSASYRYICVIGVEYELVPTNLPTLVRSICETDAALAYGNIITTQNDAVIGLDANMPLVPSLEKSHFREMLFFLDTDQILDIPDHLSRDETALQLLLVGREVVFVPVVVGYRHGFYPDSIPAERSSGESQPGAMLRKVAEVEECRAGRIYHPAVGYLNGG